MKRIHHKNFNEEFAEDATKFGEFICTFHQWLPIEEQKEHAKKMQNMTKEKN